jgi:hypothetical protein
MGWDNDLNGWLPSLQNVYSILDHIPGAVPGRYEIPIEQAPKSTPTTSSRLIQMPIAVPLSSGSKGTRKSMRTQAGAMAS